MKRLDTLVGEALRLVAIASFLALFVLVLGIVLVRFVPVVSTSWADELVELAFAWTVFFGTAAVWRERAHFRADMLLLALGRGLPRIVAEAALEAVSVAFFAVFTWLAATLWLAANDLSPILGLPRRIWYGAMPLAGFLMLVYSLVDLGRLLRGELPATAADMGPDAPPQPLPEAALQRTAQTPVREELA